MSTGRTRWRSSSAASEGCAAGPLGRAACLRNVAPRSPRTPRGLAGARDAARRAEADDPSAGAPEGQGTRSPSGSGSRAARCRRADAIRLQGRPPSRRVALHGPAYFGAGAPGQASRLLDRWTHRRHLAAIRRARVLRCRTLGRTQAILDGRPVYTTRLRAPTRESAGDDPMGPRKQISSLRNAASTRPAWAPRREDAAARVGGPLLGFAWGCRAVRPALTFDHRGGIVCPRVPRGGAPAPLAARRSKRSLRSSSVGRQRATRSRESDEPLGGGARAARFDSSATRIRGDAELSPRDCQRATGTAYAAILPAESAVRVIGHPCSIARRRQGHAVDADLSGCGLRLRDSSARPSVMPVPVA